MLPPNYNTVNEFCTSILTLVAAGSETPTHNKREWALQQRERPKPKKKRLLKKKKESSCKRSLQRKSMAVTAAPMTQTTLNCQRRKSQGWLNNTFDAQSNVSTSRAARLPHLSHPGVAIPVPACGESRSTDWEKDVGKRVMSMGPHCR